MEGKEILKRMDNIGKEETKRRQSESRKKERRRKKLEGKERQVIETNKIKKRARQHAEQDACNR